MISVETENPERKYQRLAARQASLAFVVFQHTITYQRPLLVSTGTACASSSLFEVFAAVSPLGKFARCFAQSLPVPSAAEDR